MFQHWTSCVFSAFGHTIQVSLWRVWRSKNPVLSDRTCVWCRSQLRNTPRSVTHPQRYPAKPVNMTAYGQHQCDCPRLEAVRKQLKEILATRTSDRIMVSCSPMDWLWFVQYGGMSEAELKTIVVTFWPN